MTLHALTYNEDAAEHGLDQYICLCGLVFEANGDVVAAFDHGIEVAYAESAATARLEGRLLCVKPDVLALEEEEALDADFFWEGDEEPFENREGDPAFNGAFDRW